MTALRFAAPVRVLSLLGLALAALSSPTFAAAPQPGPPLSIRRATGPITIDGNLSDPGWQGADTIRTWFETNVGDNVEPQVRNVAFLTYDDHYLYAGFEFEDPHPELIRAPLGDHDAVPSSTDYAGVIVDSRNDGKTARMFLSNPNGVQYDAVSSDVTGEDSSPDFYWESAGRITKTGWTLEIRIPFSSLRYASAPDPTWGILLYRNYPRDRRYQFFSARLPRDVNCFICNSSKLTGLGTLPHDSHLVVAPYATSSRSDAPQDGVPGNPLRNGDVKGDGGVDVKWSPLADAAIDATFNPDFSQVESDAAQLVANERFAIFYPEKRPFFLEGIDLFSTPFQAVYTRTITSPSDGLRATGRIGTDQFTALFTHDRGGGLVILPGPLGSGTAEQDFGSNVGIVRVRHDMGASFLSGLLTDREIAGGGLNRVFGPDFQWRPWPTDAFTGQALWSQSHTPDRPDLATEWDGRTLNSRASLFNWSHNKPPLDVFVQDLQIGSHFRADEGFMPQVGYREDYFESGITLRPKDTFLSRVRIFTIEYLDQAFTRQSLAQRVSVGAGADGRLNSFVRVELNQDAFRVGDLYLSRLRPRVLLQTTPAGFLTDVSIDNYFGQEIDFDNARAGTGETVIASFTIRPNGHLELANSASGRWLHVDAGGGHEGRLLEAEIGRVRATWAFNARTFVRLIGQYDVTSRDTTLYTFAIEPKDEDFSASALFAYKLNWQSVLYVGYGDDRTFEDLSGRLQPSGREAFAKVSMAFQR